GIVGGMIGATTLALFYVPMFYVIFERLAERGKKSPPPSGEGEVTPTAAPSPHVQQHADKEKKDGQSNQEGQS
ncbi:MAG: hypothetical protein ACRCUK_10355, partial [Plesiomonas shigelloides]